MQHFGVIETQEEFAKLLYSKDGTHYTQAFISKVLKNSPIPDRMISQITGLFPFTDPEYFDSGGASAINLHKFATWILSKNNKTWTDLARAIGKKRVCRIYHN